MVGCEFFNADVSTADFLPTFLKKESEAYEITRLSVCLPLVTFEPIGRFL
jgi:hypothetical protein